MVGEESVTNRRNSRYKGLGFPELLALNSERALNPCFLQSIFTTQESNLGFPYCRQSLYHLNYQGIPKGNTFMNLESSLPKLARLSEFRELGAQGSHSQDRPEKPVTISQELCRVHGY